MYMLLVFIAIIIEVLIIAGLVKLHNAIYDLQKDMPRIQDEVLKDILLLREELENLNKKLEPKPPKPLSSNEMGKIIGNILVKLLVFRKFSLSNLLMTIFKYRSRINATIESYQSN